MTDRGKGLIALTCTAALVAFAWAVRVPAPAFTAGEQTAIAVGATACETRSALRGAMDHIDNLPCQYLAQRTPATVVSVEGSEALVRSSDGAELYVWTDSLRR